MNDILNEENINDITRSYPPAAKTICLSLHQCEEQLINFSDYLALLFSTSEGRTIQIHTVKQFGVKQLS